MDKDFPRVNQLPPYVFDEIQALKAAARKEGKDIIDFGMGNPDQATPEEIVEKLRESALDPSTHRYSQSKGIPRLRKSICDWYERKFDVILDLESEAVVTMGSKEGLGHLALATLDKGDAVLVPNPSYPIHPYGFVIAGGAGVLVLEEYEHAKHKIWVIQDLAYADICFDGYKAPSILQVEGAKEVAVEFFSLSKSYNMPGWRVGFCCGNKDLLAALSRIKSYFDYGLFTPIQVAAIKALDHGDEYVEEIRLRYQSRRDVLIKGLNDAGWKVESPKATMFVWAKIPSSLRSLGSLEFSKRLLKEAEVAVSPGIGFGDYGEGFVRFSLIENEHRTRQAIRNIKKFLSKASKVQAIG